MAVVVAFYSKKKEKCYVMIGRKGCKFDNLWVSLENRNGLPCIVIDSRYTDYYYEALTEEFHNVYH